jgi:hypothetical protein
LKVVVAPSILTISAPPSGMPRRSNPGARAEDENVPGNPLADTGGFSDTG